MNEKFVEYLTEAKVKFHVYDNGGKTADRYTIIHESDLKTPNRNGSVDMLSLDEKPEHPQGISQFTTGQVGKHLGKKIKFESLPDTLQKHIKSRYNDLDESLDEGRGRPKKVVDPDAPVKEKGKRGRPKKDVNNDDDDKSGKEGVRTVTLTAKIKIDGEKKEETKVLKDIDTKDIDDEISKWEKALHKKFNFDADITISKKIGDYDVDDELDINRPAIDTDGDDY